MNRAHGTARRIPLASGGSLRCTIGTCFWGDPNRVAGSTNCSMVLAFLGHHVHSEGVALLIGVRDGPGAFDCRGLELMRLNGLAARDGAQLAKRFGATDGVAGQLAELTGGNPLALLELAGALT